MWQWHVRLVTGCHWYLPLRASGMYFLSILNQDFGLEAVQCL